MKHVYDHLLNIAESNSKSLDKDSWQTWENLYT